MPHSVKPDTVGGHVGTLPRVRASVVIPAHDEAATITATLRRLHEGWESGELEVVVVCNGCADDTAARARACSGVRVIELPQASKALAQRAGNAATGVFPRVHLDADVVLPGDDLRRLIEAVQQPGVHAAAPDRVLVLERSSWVVRWYYDVWARLPRVASGLFVRGAVALSAEGQARADALPLVLGDGLAVSDAFAAHERVVVPEARAWVTCPRRARDLVRRRVRVVTGNAQADLLGIRPERSATGVRDVVSLAGRDPRLAPKVVVFAVVTLLGRWRARRFIAKADFTTWLRDDGSRAGGG